MKVTENTNRDYEQFCPKCFTPADKENPYKCRACDPELQRAKIIEILEAPPRFSLQDGQDPIF
jgi:hypothetical protein